MSIYPTTIGRNENTKTSPESIVFRMYDRKQPTHWTPAVSAYLARPMADERKKPKNIRQEQGSWKKIALSMTDWSPEGRVYTSGSVQIRWNRMQKADLRLSGSTEDAEKVANELEVAELGLEENFTEAVKAIQRAAEEDELERMFRESERTIEDAAEQYEKDVAEEREQEQKLANILKAEIKRLG